MSDAFTSNISMQDLFGGSNSTQNEFDISSYIPNVADKANILAEQKQKDKAEIEALNTQEEPVVSQPLTDNMKAFLSGNEADGLNYVQTHSKPKPVLDYVNASQARIYIGGVLVDEVYDLQYSYRESKEPIYGYNSKYYDAILPGNVLVYGSFTINYIHDAYLYAVLSRQGLDDIDSSKKEYSDNKKLEDTFKKKLLTYKGKQQEIKELKSQILSKKNTLKDAQAFVNDSLYRDNLKTKDLELELKNAKEERDAFWNQFTPLYRGQLEDKINNFRNAINGNGKYSLKSRLDQKDQELNAISQQISNKQQYYNQYVSERDNIQQEIYNLQDLLKVTKQTNPDYGRIVQEINNRSAIVEQYGDYIIEIYNEILELNSQRNDIMQVLEGDIEYQNTAIQSISNEDPNIAEAEKLDLRIKNIEDKIASEIRSQESGMIVNSDFLKEANYDYRSIEDKISILEGELDVIRNELSKIKSNTIGVKTLSGLIETSNEENKRAENMNSFTIFIEYNGTIHKIIEKVELTGHTHQVSSADGSAIKEVYTFIAKDIK